MLLLAVIVLLALYYFRAVILPFAVSAFLAYLIAPVIAKLSTLRVGKRLVHRAVAIMIVYSVALGMITLGGFYLIPKLTTEANRLVRDLPQILRELETTVVAPLDAKVNSWLAEFVPLPTGVEEAAESAEETKAENLGTNGGDAPAPRSANGIVGQLMEDYTFVVERKDENRFEIIPTRRDQNKARDPEKNFDFSRQLTTVFSQFRGHFESNFVELLRLSRTYVLAIVGSFFTTFLVLMTSAFILLDPRRMTDFLCSLVPKRHHGSFDELMKALDRGLSGVVRGQVLICLINGSATGIGIAVIGVPFVFTLTLIATVFSLIPIFGVLISTIPIMLIALTVSFSTALMALGWILAVHFVEGNFLNPKIMGDYSKIHPVFIIFALVAGQYLAGIMGALLAVPAFSLLQNTFLFVKRLAEEVEAAT